jgi:hypothetical protein
MAILEGGDSGPAVIPGMAKDSLLWKRVSLDEMPPGKEKLSLSQKKVIENWIDGGAGETVSSVRGLASGGKAKPIAERTITAGERSFWSFQPPRRPAIPSVMHREWVKNPIDAFLIAALEAKGLGFSKQADRSTLLRRATFDLTGLPPTAEENERFLSDTSPDAYERVVEQLLASPHYGERWGRHWLDW